MKVNALIALGGSSNRTQGIVKQFYQVKDKPLWFYTINAFNTHSLIDNIYIICRQEDCQYYYQEVKKNNLYKVKKIIIGGATRNQSIRNGINAIEEGEYVLIHDGARPLVSSEIISNVIEALKSSPTVLTALISSDSVYQLDKAIVPLDRDKVYLAQTPQAFHLPLIKEAYNKITDKDYSDDCQIFYAHYKLSPKIVCGDKKNFKVTTQEDFALLSSLINE